MQIFAIAHTHRQADIPVTLRLARRKILFAVQGNGNGIRRMFKNSCSTVALMHIAVKNQHAVYPAAFQHIAADDRQIVEDAKTRRVIVVRVMSAARQMAGQAVLKRLLGGQQRSAHGANGTSRQCLAPGQAQAALIFAGQLACHIALDIAAVMGQGEDIHRA